MPLRVSTSLANLPVKVYGVDNKNLFMIVNEFGRTYKQ